MTSQEEGILADGLGAGPGTASGDVRIVTKLDRLDKVESGDIIVTEMTTPDMVPAMKRAAGLVTDEGGMTSHAAIVSRELGVPAVVGDERRDGAPPGRPARYHRRRTGDRPPGQLGRFRSGRRRRTADCDVAGRTVRQAADQQSSPTGQPATKPMTGTEIKVNRLHPGRGRTGGRYRRRRRGLAPHRARSSSTSKTPEASIADHGERAYVDEIVEGAHRRRVLLPTSGAGPTLDAPTDEFRQLDGGEDEPNEHNPMLGYRGIRRSLDRPETFRLELEAFRRLYDMGYDNVELMLLLVTDAEDVLRAKAIMEDVGL